MVVMVFAAAMVVIVVVLVIVLMVVIVVVLVIVLMVVIVIMMVFMFVIVIMLVIMFVMMIMMVFMIMVMVLRLVFSRLGLVFRTHFGQQFFRQGYLFNCGENYLAVQLIPGGGEDGGLRVFFLEHGHSGLQLFLAEFLGAGEDNGPGAFDLVVVELPEILHIDLHLAGIGHGDKAVQLQFRHLGGSVLHRHNHVRKLAYARGLNEDPIRVELIRHVLQGLVEVPYQGTADAPGGHFGNLDAGLLQKAAVNADLAKLVLNENQLLAGESLCQKLFDERGFARPQESGDNVDFRHNIKSLSWNPQAVFPRVPYISKRELYYH